MEKLRESPSQTVALVENMTVGFRLSALPPIEQPEKGIGAGIVEGTGYTPPQDARG
jgi:hypothetical protein